MSRQNRLRCAVLQQTSETGLLLRVDVHIRLVQHYHRVRCYTCQKPCDLQPHLHPMPEIGGLSNKSVFIDQECQRIAVVGIRCVEGGDPYVAPAALKESHEGRKMLVEESQLIAEMTRCKVRVEALQDVLPFQCRLLFLKRPDLR